MSVEVKRTRAEPKNYNLTRNYTVKRQRSDSGQTKRRIKDYGIQTTIIDSGGYSVKYGNANSEEPEIMPNCIIKAKAERKRPFIGNQIEDCRDLSGLYYLLPCEKGYVTKWDVQKPIWDHIFQSNSIEDHSVIMTQPLLNFRSIQECMDEIMFEEYEVQSLVRANPTDLAYYKHIKADTNEATPPCLVVDSGFSFTHIVPYLEGKKYFPNTIRIDVGGKFLTNYMKDIISYRQLHVMEETYVINQVKEDACFVSLDLREDMKIASSSSSDKNTIVRNYVLPDFNNIRRGYIQEPGTTLQEVAEGCQILRLNNERFTVPELLLHPSNVGMECMGIAEAITKCIKKCPIKYQAGLAKNIVVIGGNAKFPGFKARIFNDVRALLPYHLRLNVIKPDNPITYAWMGGKTLSKSPYFEKLVVTKLEYEEYGSNLTYKRFNNFKTTVVQDKVIAQNPAPKYSLLSNIKGRSIFGKHDLTVETNNKEEVVEEEESNNNSTKTSESLEEQEEDKKSPVTSEASSPSTSTLSSPVSIVLNGSVNNKPGLKTGVVVLEDMFKKQPVVQAIRMPVFQSPTRNVMQVLSPGQQPVRQVLRIHLPRHPTIQKMTLNDTAKIINHNIIRMPIHRTPSGQRITFQNPVVQLPLLNPASLNSGNNQFLKVNYSVPKLTTIRAQTQTSPSTASSTITSCSTLSSVNTSVSSESSSSASSSANSTPTQSTSANYKDLYPQLTAESKVVLVKQVFLKKN